ncbi:MAG: amidohydrolase family protein, partial [Clostridia bacterium]|nr:amidohydrolase family protein [Clostridia bacterium]
MKADKVFVNGTIYTMDPKNPKAEAVATFGKMILGVGQKSDMESLIGPDTKVIDLGGRTMIPGINDSHSHVIMYGINLTLVDLDPSKCPDIATMKKLVAERAALLGPGKWVQGWGWDETRMTDGRMPNADDMSEACPNNPVTLTRGCVHMILTNRMGLDMAGVTNDTPDPEGGKIVRDEHGVATGLMQDNAQNFIKNIVPPYTKDEMVAAIETASKAYNSKGITSSCDAGTLISVEGENQAWYEA